MVKKLFKHEFRAWLRILPLIYAIVLAAAILQRVIQVPMNAGPLFYRLREAVSNVYAFVALACVPAAICFGITRFYKNLFTGEGYLTFALPVSVNGHLLTKLTTAVCFALASALVSLVSLIIISPEDFQDFLAWIYTESFPPEFLFHGLSYLIELVLLLVAGIANAFLLSYTCICIGQLARKNRVLAAIGTFFGIYLISQFASAFLLGFLIEAYTSSGFYHYFLALGDQGILVMIHILLCTILLWTLLISGAYYSICHYIMRNRLNLE